MQTQYYHVKLYTYTVVFSPLSHFDMITQNDCHLILFSHMAIEIYRNMTLSQVSTFSLGELSYHECKLVYRLCQINIVRYRVKSGCREATLISKCSGHNQFNLEGRGLFSPGYGDPVLHIGKR